MPLLFRQPRTSQPQGAAKIDWGNPITKGLLFALSPTVDDKPYSTSGLPVHVGRFGTMASDGGQFAGATISNARANELNLTATSSKTFLVFADQGSSSGAYAIAMFNGGFNTGTYLIQIKGGVRLAYTNNLGQGEIQGVLYAAPVGRLVGVVVANAGNVKTYINGSFAGDQTLSLYSGGFSGTGSLSLRSKTTDGVHTFLGASWNRALSDAEIKSLSDNPWQIFAPQSRQIWVPASAGGTHPSSGALAADPATIAGAAIRLAMHTSSGALAAQAASITGTATRFVTHPSSGALAASAAAIAGTATHLTLHPSSGALAAQAATIVGTAARASPGIHPSSGALAADSATIAGTAAHLSLHPSSGALAAQDAVIAGTALRTTPTLPTVGRPASDTSNSGWLPSTGSALYPMLDEVVPDAADYIYATAMGSICEVALDTTAYPGTAAQVLKFRGSSSTGNSVIVRLKNTGGATVRSTTQPLTVTDTEYTVTLTSGEIAAITSGALSVEMESA